MPTEAPETPESTAESPETPSGGSRWRGRLVALSAGLALVALAEAFLLAVDYGGPLAMFLAVPDGEASRSHVTNPGAFRAVFGSDPAFRGRRLPAPHPQRFAVDKGPATRRIIVMGGSAAKGWPQPLCGSFPVFLQSILNRVCEGARWEVINAGVTALNTWSLMKRTEEAFRYDPDLLVFYTGHNEFYGAYGPGSAIPLVSYRPLTLAQLWLRRRRLSMVVSDLLIALVGQPAGADSARALAQHMARQTDIRHGGELYGRVRANYRENLRRILLACRERGTPAVLCTVGSNLRDFPPIGSVLPPQLAGPQRHGWTRRLEVAARLLEGGRPDSARASLRGLLDEAPGHARAHFLMACSLESLNRSARAAGHYRRARDLDTYRWRAPGDFNQVVRDLAGKSRADGVVLCDAAAALVQRSPHVVPGREMFLEHVHLTLEGNFAVAEALARSVAASPAAAGCSWNWQRHRRAAWYAPRQGVSDIDRSVTAATAGLLYGSAFPDLPEAEAAKGRLLAEARRIRDSLSPPQRAAYRAGLAAVRESGRRDWYDVFHLALAAEYERRDDYRKALRQVEYVLEYGAAVTDNARYAALHAEKARLEMKRGRRQAASRLIERALELDEDCPEARRLLARTGWPGQ